MSIDADLRRGGYRRDPETLVWSKDATAPFAYSDGEEIEGRLERIVEEAVDLSAASPELAAAITDWPSLYHLSPRRSNLLRPFVEEMPGPLLEIGAGMGVLTRFVGETGAEVLALEGSPRRARIAARRCAELPNVHVVAEPFQSFTGSAITSFGSVLLIGVLEYARVHSASVENGMDPVDALLAAVRGMLTDDGILHLAIENQLGLKYFAGYPEDHLGDRMLGIEDRYGPDTIVTFGRAELKRRLDAAGFAAQDWWFPLPDYKLPATLISERAVGTALDLGSLAAATVLFDAQRTPYSTFSLQQSWATIARNDLMPDLANSFLVRASATELTAGVELAWHYGSTRARHFAKSVRFQEAADGSIEIQRRLLEVETSAIPANERSVAIQIADEPFAAGENARDRLAALVARPGWTLDQVVQWADVWWRAVLAEVGADADIDSEIDGNLLDAIPHNLLIDGNDFRFIDLEWISLEPLLLGRLLFRGLADSLLSIERFATPGAPIDLRLSSMIGVVSAGLGMPLDDVRIGQFSEEESRFQAEAAGVPFEFNLDDTMARTIAVTPGLGQVFLRAVESDGIEARLAVANQRIAELEAVQRTVSWRITAPLRAVRRLMRWRRR